MSSKRVLRRNGYLRPREVADLLQVTPGAVRQWAQNGRLPSTTTPGGHRRFALQDVEMFAKAYKKSPRRESGPPAPGGGQRVLIIDDDDQIVFVLSEMLKLWDKSVVVESAADGFEAGLTIARFMPHIVLLDLWMPGLDGFEVCHRLKSKPETAAIRVIAMTGYHSTENINRILQLGAEACLAKPFSKNAVMTILDAPEMMCDRRTGVG